MGKKRHTAEVIVSKLRQVDVLTVQGRTVAEAIRVRRAQTLPGQAAQRVGTGERQAAPGRLGSHPRETDPQGGRLGTRRAASANLVSPPAAPVWSM